MVRHWPPTFEVAGSNPEPHVGKMVVSYRWLAVYSTEASKLYILVSSAHKTILCDMTYTVLKATLKSK